MLSANVGARRFVRTIRDLARESDRIGNLDLERPVVVRARASELVALAAAQEKMRQALLEATRDLERKVEERTREIQDAQTKLRRGERRSRKAVFESATMGIALIRNRIIESCNRKLEELFGLTPGEFAGKPTRVWYCERRGIPQRWRRGLRAARARRDPPARAAAAAQGRQPLLVPAVGTRRRSGRSRQGDGLDHRRRDRRARGSRGDARGAADRRGSDARPSRRSSPT
jgi:PAS domain-containing protein